MGIQVPFSRNRGVADDASTRRFLISITYFEFPIAILAIITTGNAEMTKPNGRGLFGKTLAAFPKRRLEFNLILVP